MSATVSGAGNLELIQKHNFKSLRAQIVYTHYRIKRTISKGRTDTFWLMVLFYFGENPQSPWLYYF